jgi:hypothetical protein
MEMFIDNRMWVMYNYGYKGNKQIKIIISVKYQHKTLQRNSKQDILV